jgi:hypothetical protein
MKYNIENREYKSFISYLNEKKQRQELTIILSIYLIVYFILTYFYPYPDGISDSGGYVLAASNNKFMGYRPFGYSRFLIMLHHINSSMRAIVMVQYIINIISSLFLLYSIKFFYRPANKTINVLLTLFALGSIPFIYLTNTILSDSLFTSLTYTWVALCIWFLNKEGVVSRLFLFFFLCINLMFLLNLRYTGLFYIVVQIMLIIFCFFKQKRIIGIGMIAIILVLTSGFYQKQVKRTKKDIGIKVFSGFSGWQLANNALHLIPYVKFDPNDIEDTQTREFAKYIDSKDSLFVLEGYKVTAKFMWDNKSPLKIYLKAQMKQLNKTYLVTYTYLGKNVYSKFGKYIMLHYPGAYIYHFILPNTWLTLYPTVDQVSDRFDPDAVPESLRKSWFKMDEKEKPFVRFALIEKLHKVFPITSFLYWILTISSIIYLFVFIKAKNIFITSFYKQLYWFLVIFTAGYTAFNIYASPFELRYTAPIHILQVTLIYISINHLISLKKTV